ncbi:MAG: hypothetical protein MJK18_08090 [Bdellovibrionales bacterium]|nr:hypothetical protein [Bdellovibrionales bacterium]
MALAINGAKQGKKVAAITIDPSRRLAKTLGLENSSFKEVDWPEFDNPMDVYFLNAEESFNEFVKGQLSKSVFDKVQRNRIFSQISKNLRETHNFAAIYRLDEILKNKDYDLVILDTPPSQQAIDFFEAPEKLIKFFTRKNSKKKSGVVKWIQGKGLELIETLLMNMAGKEFLKETELFFDQVGQLRDDINGVSQEFLKLMKSSESQLLLVSSPALDKISEATYLQQKISQQGYKLNWCVLNRAYQAQLDFGKDSVSFADPREEELYNYYVGQLSHSETMVDDLKKKEVFKNTDFLLIPEFVDLDEDKESLLALAKEVDNYWEV